MIDLTNYVNQYDIRWTDGEVLHLKKPSQELFTRMMKVEEYQNVDEIFDEITDIFKCILETNTAGRTFTKEEIEELPLDAIMDVFEDYTQSVLVKLGE